jgi:tetratricopeptide (TPR) repeat protein
LRNVDNLAEARAMFEKSASLSKEIGDVATEILALINLATMSSAADDYQRAEQLIEQSLKLSKEKNLKWQEAQAWLVLGKCLTAKVQSASSQKRID